MAPPPIVVATLQASVLAALSNVLAQVLTSYRKEVQAALRPSFIPYIHAMVDPREVLVQNTNVVTRSLSS